MTPQRGQEVLELLQTLRAAGVPARRTHGILEIPRHGARALQGAGVALTWTADAEQYVANLHVAERSKAALAHVLQRLQDGGVDAARRMLGDVTLLPGLDDHQVVNVAGMTAPGACGLCLFDEQGAGKTVSLIAAFDVLVQRDEADLMLVFSPKSMIGEWVKDFRRFTGDLYRVVPVTGTSEQRRHALATRAEVFITNYESAVGSGDELAALVSRHRQRAVLAVDESYHVKNDQTLRSRAVHALRQVAGRAYVLCGTPAPNTAHDLVAQVSLVDLGETFSAVDLPTDPVAARHLVREALDDNPVYLRNLKANVLPELPGRTYQRTVVPMAPHQRLLYDRARDSLVEDLRSISDAEFQRHRVSFAARRATLLRLCSNPKGIVSDYDETSAKETALDALLAERCGNGEKVVVWSFFTASAAALMARYVHYGAVRYDGSVTDAAERARLVSRFQEDDTTLVFVANPAAAGAGITLHRSRTAIYESMSNQPAHYLQSLDRIHRRGQDRDVEYFFLLCQDSLEEPEYDRLLQKQMSARELLLDDDEPPATRTSMLAELLGPDETP